MASYEALKEELVQADPEFRRLFEEHQQCERRLTELLHKSFPSEQDESEQKQLKLHKLMLKDRMATLARAYEGSRLALTH
ncbi:MAG: YdcH family protein [Thermoanaerobaculia bacterium]